MNPVTKESLLPVWAEQTDIQTFDEHQMAKFCCHNGHEEVTKLFYRLQGAKCSECNLAEIRKDPRKKSTNAVLTSSQALMSAVDWPANREAGIDINTLSSRNTSVQVHWICTALLHRWTCTVGIQFKRKACTECRNQEKNPSLFLVNHEQFRYYSSDQNPGINPKTILTYDRRELKWFSQDCGHDWEASTRYQIRFGGCRTCRSAREISNPVSANAVLKEMWSSSNTVSPDTVSNGSSERYLWTCGKQDHEFEARVCDVKANSECRTCKKEVRDAQTTYVSQDPALLPFWNDERDSATVTNQSSLAADWKCPTCFTTWISTVQVQQRQAERGMPCSECAPKDESLTYVAGDPILAPYWADEERKATEVAHRSGYRAHWRCPTCMDTWDLSPNDQARRIHGCLSCKNGPFLCQIQTNLPSLVDAIDPKNFPIKSPIELTWSCGIHQWKKSVKELLADNSCPECSSLPSAATTSTGGKSLIPSATGKRKRAADTTSHQEKRAKIKTSELLPETKIVLLCLVSHLHRWEITWGEVMNDPGCPTCNLQKDVETAVIKDDLRNL